MLRSKLQKMQLDNLSSQSKGNWISNLLRWCPTSAVLLEQAEKKIFSYLAKPYNLSYTILSATEYKIRTVLVCTNNEENSTPLVLLHGFASGIGLWVMNIDYLSHNRSLYALDILGFGRSSRPQFSKNAAEAENQLVESIEEWRKSMGLNKFILLGHSMGGFLASSYAIKYPDRIKHLILADPWGFPESTMESRKVEIPFWVKTIASVLQPFNPLAGLRIAGPWGPQLVEKFRPDIIKKFEPVVHDSSDVSNYIYHCNAQTPSGEAAFKAMTAQFGWAKLPMINRISQLREDISITFIYGSRSWIDSKSGLEVKALRQNSSVDIKLIQGAGHHVYADRPEEFNAIVANACKKADAKNPVLLSDSL